MGERPKFKKGDLVTWSSQAGGHARSKIGEVLEVVSPNKMPILKVKDPGSSRNHESYVVRASYEGANGKVRTTNYWPVVNKLELKSKREEERPTLVATKETTKEEAEPTESIIEELEEPEELNEIESNKIEEKEEEEERPPAQPLNLDEIEPLFTKEELRKKP